MFPAQFATHRLLLRPIEMADAPAVFETYAQDTDVTRYLTWRPHTSLESTRRYLAACASAAHARTYAIVSRDDPRLIGAFDLRHHEPWRMGFGYVLARPYWGKGLMTEALGAVVAWALSEPSIWRIGDVVDVQNVASGRVMQKAGLAFEGRLRRWAPHPNVGPEPRDCFVYARVRDAG